MSVSLSVSSSPPVHTAPAAAAVQTASTSSTTPSTASTTSTTAPVYTNPSSYIDPALNIVVTQYHNAAGDVTEQTPTARQLASYQNAMSAGAPAIAAAASIVAANSDASSANAGTKTQNAGVSATS